jgi:hypothetical protein
MRSKKRELGRRRLALRLPKLRSRIMNTVLPWHLDLFEAYELSIEFREVMRVSPSQEDLFQEYVRTCLDLEREVARAITENNNRAGTGVDQSNRLGTPR